MKNCSYCGCNTSDEHNFCPKCGRDLVTVMSSDTYDATDPALKEMYDKLMAQKLTLSAMYFNQASQTAVSNGEIVHDAPVAKQAEKALKKSKYERNADNFTKTYVNKNGVARGSLFRLFVFIIASLGLGVVYFLSITFNKDFEITGFNGLSSMIERLFSIDFGEPGKAFNVQWELITGFDGICFKAMGYTLLVYTVFALLAVIFSCFTFKYHKPVKVFLVLSFVVTLLCLTVIAVADLLVFKFNEVSLGVIIAAAINILMLFFIGLGYRRKKTANADA